MRSIKFFKLVTVTFEKQLSELRKKWQPNVWNLFSCKKNGINHLSEKTYIETSEVSICVKKSLLKKCILAIKEVIFLRLLLKYVQSEIFNLVRIWFEKHVFEVRKKWKKQAFEISIRVKKNCNNILSKSYVFAPKEVKAYLVSTNPCAQEFFSNWSESN